MHFCGYCEALAVDKAVDNRVDNFGDRRERYQGGRG